MTISLPADLLEDVDLVASSRDMPRSTLITAMLAASVERAKIDGPPAARSLTTAIAEAQEKGAIQAVAILTSALKRFATTESMGG